MDHLNGVLFVDYLLKLKKDMIIKKLVKQKKTKIKLLYKSDVIKFIFMGMPNFLFQF